MGEAGKPEHVAVEPVGRGLARGRGEDQGDVLENCKQAVALSEG
jgi:hypothetical protein